MKKEQEKRTMKTIEKNQRLRKKELFLKLKAAIQFLFKKTSICR